MDLEKSSSFKTFFDKRKASSVTKEDLILAFSI